MIKVDGNRLSAGPWEGTTRSCIGLCHQKIWLCRPLSCTHSPHKPPDSPDVKPPPSISALPVALTTCSRLATSMFMALAVAMTTAALWTLFCRLLSCALRLSEYRVTELLSLYCSDTQHDMCYIIDFLRLAVFIHRQIVIHRCGEINPDSVASRTYCCVFLLQLKKIIVQTVMNLCKFMFCNQLNKCVFTCSSSSLEQPAFSNKLQSKLW